MKFTSIAKLDKNEIYTLVRNNLYECKETRQVLINDDSFHHNTAYQNLTSVLTNGILSFNEMVKKGLNKSSHQAVDNVNGEKYVSVSRIEACDPKYYIYTPNLTLAPDLIVGEDIQKIRNVMRNSMNYANEYLIENSVPIEYIEVITTRLMRLANLVDRETMGSVTKERFISAYNSLIDVLTILEQLNIPLVDNSEEVITINKQKLLSHGKLKI